MVATDAIVPKKDSCITKGEPKYYRSSRTVSKIVRADVHCVVPTVEMTSKRVRKKR